MSIYVLAPIASVLMIYLARMVELAKKRDTIRGRVRENLTLRLFMLAGTFMVIGSIFEFLYMHSRLYWPTFFVGWLVAILSIVLRRRAISALGKFWSLHVEIRENHVFVRSGPFRFIRHPTYFSMILELLSIRLILNASITLGLTALIFIPALIMRVLLEEKALIEKFGAAYVAYQREIPALFPYKWPTTK